MLIVITNIHSSYEEYCNNLCRLFTTIAIFQYDIAAVVCVFVCKSFRDLRLRVEMAPFCLNHVYTVLFTFKWRPMFPANKTLTACSRQCNMDSVWTGVFAKSAR